MDEAEKMDDTEDDEHVMIHEGHPTFGPEDEEYEMPEFCLQLAREGSHLCDAAVDLPYICDDNCPAEYSLDSAAPRQSVHSAEDIEEDVIDEIII